MASDVRVTANDPHPSTSNFFSLCCCGSNVYVLWQDDRAGAADVLLNSSRDRGKTWRGGPVRQVADHHGISSEIVLRLSGDPASLFDRLGGLAPQELVLALGDSARDHVVFGCGLELGPEPEPGFGAVEGNDFDRMGHRIFMCCFGCAILNPSDAKL